MGFKVKLGGFFAVLLILSLIAFASHFIDSSQSDFNLGTYVNTTHNGSVVVLSGSNTTGTYTSQIFDATSDASWTNISWHENKPYTDLLFAVDGQGAVYSSSNGGITWILKNSGYGRTSDTQDMFSDSSNNLYIIAGSNREV